MMNDKYCLEGKCETGKGKDGNGSLKKVMNDWAFKKKQKWWRWLWL